MTGSQRDEYPQVFTEIDVVHEVTGPDLSEAAIRRAIELSATKYCPVNAMLSAGATVVHHRYVVHSTGAAAVRGRRRGRGDRSVRPPRHHRLTEPVAGRTSVIPSSPVGFVWYSAASRRATDAMPIR